MGWWPRWLGRGVSPSVRPREAWRRAWNGALEQADPDIEGLRRQLGALGLPAEEVDLEQEMLDGLTALAALRGRLHSTGLPIVETGHRVIGTELCHFTAPVCMPDRPSQPAGRLLFTPTRAVFVGGGATTSIAWHAVSDARLDARDLVLVRAGGDNLFRFQANAYADALCGAELARYLVARQRRTL